MNSFYKRLAAVSLLKTTTKISAANCLSKLILGKRWSLKESKDFIQYIKDTEKRFEIASGLLVEQRGGNFFLLSADRQTFITEEFLDRCAKDHADNIRNAMLALSLRQTNDQGGTDK